MKKSLDWIKDHQYGIKIILWILVILHSLATKNYDSALLILIIILDQCMLSMSDLEMKQQEEQIDYWRHLSESYLEQSQRISKQNQQLLNTIKRER